MEYKKLIDDVEIPVLGMGTAGMGEGLTPNRSQDKIDIETLREGVKLGMTHIDTAEIYANGHSEEVVGEAIKPFKREDVFITTKVSPRNLVFDDLINAIKGSLKRLKLDFVDLYLIHQPNPKIPLKETMGAMEYVVEQGYTRFIGVSNFSVGLMKKAQSYTTKKIVANQVEYSLLHRDPEKDLLPYCQHNDIMLIAYMPLAQGRLTKPRFKLLDGIAEKYNRTQAQVALNWLTSKEKVVAIPKAVRLEHLKDNFGSMGWKLKDEDMEKLDKKMFKSFLDNSVMRLKKEASFFLNFRLGSDSLITRCVKSVYALTKHKK